MAVKISVSIVRGDMLFQCIYESVRKTSGKNIYSDISGKSFGHEWLSVFAGWVSVICYRLFETIVYCFTFSSFYDCIDVHYIGRGAPNGFTSSPHNGVEDSSYPGPIIS